MVGCKIRISAWAVQAHTATTGDDAMISKKKEKLIERIVEASRALLGSDDELSDEALLQVAINYLEDEAETPDALTERFEETQDTLMGDLADFIGNLENLRSEVRAGIGPDVYYGKMIKDFDELLLRIREYDYALVDVYNEADGTYSDENPPTPSSTAKEASLATTSTLIVERLEDVRKHIDAMFVAAVRDEPIDEATVAHMRLTLPTLVENLEAYVEAYSEGNK